MLQLLCWVDVKWDGSVDVSSLLCIIRDVRVVAEHPGVHQRYTLVVVLSRVKAGGDDFDVLVDVFVVEYFSRDLDVIVGYCKFHTN